MRNELKESYERVSPGTIPDDIYIHEITEKELAKYFNNGFTDIRVPIDLTCVSYNPVIIDVGRLNMSVTKRLTTYEDFLIGKDESSPFRTNIYKDKALFSEPISMPRPRRCDITNSDTELIVRLSSKDKKLSKNETVFNDGILEGLEIMPYFKSGRETYRRGNVVSTVNKVDFEIVPLYALK